MTRLNVMDARKAFSDTVSRVAFGGERIVLERHGKPVAALVSVEDLRLLQQALEAAEDREDVAAARAALADGELLPYAKVRKRLGL